MAAPEPAASANAAPATPGPTALEHVPCPVCGAPEGPVAIEENGFQARRCPGCGLLYVSPRPSGAQVRAIYEHDEAQTASRQQIAKARAPEALAHARHTLALLRSASPEGVPPGSLLEIGPGSGLFLGEARAAGYTVAGVEPNPVQAAFIGATLGIACETAALSGASFGGRRFDVIYQCNVLSHFPDPVGVFRALRERLAPGGVMVVETGNYADVSPRFFPLITDTERFQLPDHLCFFGERSLAALLAASGFEIVALHRYSRVGEKRGPRVAAAVGLSGWARRNRHFLKYGLGRWLPKAGRPQAWIVVVRSREEEPPAVGARTDIPGKDV